MHASLITISAALLSSYGVAAAPASQYQFPSWDPSNPSWANGIPRKYSAGFEKPAVSASKAGVAVCIGGNVPVVVDAPAVPLDIPLPQNQSDVTELFFEFLQADGPFARATSAAASNASASSSSSSTVSTPMHQVSGNYSIYGLLCYPRATGINASNIQILTHGIGWGAKYWDVAPGYSYVDVAAQQGYTTFSYDRLGVGASDHPDPINVVQTSTEITVLHSLVTSLRKGALACTSFKKVIGIGHSLGSAITSGLTAAVPTDLDAAILTGYSLSSTGLPTFFAAQDFTIANQSDPTRFSHLNSGYLVANNIIGTQFAFFRSPNFPAANLAIAQASAQTLTIGELFSTIEPPKPAANYTGAVQVVTGANDQPFCDGDCLSGGQDALLAVKKLYPKASAFGTFMPNGTGHAVNLHYAAHESYEQIMAFLAKNGF